MNKKFNYLIFILSFISYPVLCERPIYFAGTFYIEDYNIGHTLKIGNSTMFKDFLSASFPIHYVDKENKHKAIENNLKKSELLLVENTLCDTKPQNMINAFTVLSKVSCNDSSIDNFSNKLAVFDMNSKMILIPEILKYEESILNTSMDIITFLKAHKDPKVNKIKKDKVVKVSEYRVNEDVAIESLIFDITGDVKVRQKSRLVRQILIYKHGNKKRLLGYSNSKKHYYGYFTRKFDREHHILGHEMKNFKFYDINADGNPDLFLIHDQDFLIYFDGNKFQLVTPITKYSHDIEFRI